MFGTREMFTTPAWTAATCEPSSRFSERTASTGSRRISARVSQAKAGAAPTSKRSRILALAPSGVRASKSRTNSVLGSAEARCGAVVHGTCRAPEPATASRRLGSASTRTSWPRWTSAPATLRTGGELPPPSQSVKSSRLIRPPPRSPHVRASRPRRRTGRSRRGPTRASPPPRRHGSGPARGGGSSR